MTQQTTDKRQKATGKRIDGRYNHCSPAQSLLIFDQGVDSIKGSNLQLADRWRIQRYVDIITLQHEAKRFEADNRR